MIKIKNKLLGIVDSEDDLVFNENPFVRKLMRNNSVYYFRGLFMKVWANGPFQYQTQKVNECWTFTYGQGRTQLSDGQELIRVINFESDGKRDNEGFMTFKLPESSIEIIGEDVTFYVKEGTSPDTVILKVFVVSEDEEDEGNEEEEEDEEKGEWQIQEIPSYQVDPEQSDSEYMFYSIAKLNAPGTGYADVWGTVGPCEGKKIYIHDEYFALEHPESAITKLIFSKEVESIPVGELRGLYNLTEITLPPKLKSIGNITFSYCYSLSSLTIPSNVTFIDSEAFFGCNNLTNIYFDNSITMLPSGAPWGAENSSVIHCKDGDYVIEQ